MRRGSSLGVCDGIASYDLTRQTGNNSAVYLPTFSVPKAGDFFPADCRADDPTISEDCRKISKKIRGIPKF